MVPISDDTEVSFARFCTDSNSMVAPSRDSNMPDQLVCTSHQSSLTPRFLTKVPLAR